MTPQTQFRLKILLPIAVLVVGMLGAMVMVRSRPQVETRQRGSSAPLVRVMTVHTQDLQLSVRTQGTVVPRTESTLVPEVAGRVVSVAPQFAAGGFFDQGDVLLTIESSDYKAVVANARSLVAQAELRLAREEEEAEIARRDWQDLGSGEPTPLALREPQVEEARAAARAARATLAKAQRDLERTRIRAPFDGRVRQKQVDVGQFVTMGVPVAVIYSVDFAEVRLPLPDRQLAYLDFPLGRRQGDSEADFDPEVVLRGSFAGGEHEWRGRIVRTEGELDPRSRMVHMIARVEDPYGRHDDSERPPLPVGLYVHAEIMGRLVEDVVVLPRAALRGTDHVLVVDDQDRLEFRRVEVLQTEREHVVIEEGLVDGERVCLSQLDTPVDGMAVRTVQDDLPPEESEL